METREAWKKREPDPMNPRYRDEDGCTDWERYDNDWNDWFFSRYGNVPVLLTMPVTTDDFGHSCACCYQLVPQRSIADLIAGLVA